MLFWTILRFLMIIKDLEVIEVKASSKTTSEIELLIWLGVGEISPVHFKKSKLGG